MKCNKWYMAILCGVVILGISSLSNAFEVHLKKNQINEAIKYGKQYKGIDIFNSDIIKSACFGEFPDRWRGMIMSKYVEIASFSAMKEMVNKPITEKELEEIVKSTELKVIVYISGIKVDDPGDIQIVLVQGMNNILPMNTEFGRNKLSVVGFFSYDEVDTKASTAIEIRYRNAQSKYRIRFSSIK